jgi:quercetin dioxygenase-like cupin family protein
MKCGAALAVAFSLGVVLSAQVPVIKEPHHRVVLDTILLRVLEVSIPAGETTLDHVHDRDIATVALGEATTRTRAGDEAWGEPRTRTPGSVNVTSYTDTPAAHRVENIGTTAYHVVGVENLRAGGWLSTKQVAAPGTTVLRQTRAFIVYDVRLDAATPVSNHPHELPLVAVLLSGTIENQGGNGETPARFDQPGRWIFIPGGHNLRVGPSGTAHLVEIEVR